MSIPLTAALLIVLLATAASPAQTPLGTAFTYQGQLKDGGAPANGPYDFQFALFDAATGGTQQGVTLTFDGNGTNPPPITVAGGLFTGLLDLADIDPFVAVQSGGTPCSVDNCDVNGDGVIDFNDIDPFVALLSSGATCP